jgi:hypothetical protein
MEDEEGDESRASGDRSTVEWSSRVEDVLSSVVASNGGGDSDGGRR